ncbi:MAG TPA: S1C family serine protease [Rhizomicrobium sp.]|nr:S1C family serine protease [Rhizomicrobium sp.]
MTQGILKELSAALAAQATDTRAFTAEIHIEGSRHRSGTVWRPDIIVTSEQSLPDAESYEIVIAGNAPVRATLVGRDPGTNVAVLKLDAPAAASLPKAGEAVAGSFALAIGADGYGGIAARLGIVSAVAPEWRSRGGGRVDRRITLDMRLSHHEDGGPVLDASGNLLGISTLGHRESILAIPPSTVERSVGILLEHGRVERGWLGVALQPVAVPEELRAAAGQESALMVMSADKEGPAAAAGITTGDVLLQIDGTALDRMHALPDSLGSENVGKQVEVKLIRAGAIRAVTATIAARPAASEERDRKAEQWKQMAEHRRHHHHHRGRHGC